MCGALRVLSWGLGYLRLGIWMPTLLIPFTKMSLSDQHPYALFVSGGLRSPSLAKAVRVTLP